MTGRGDEQAAVRLVRPGVLDDAGPLTAIRGLRRIADWPTHGTA